MEIVNICTNIIFFKKKNMWSFHSWSKALARCPLQPVRPISCTYPSSIVGGWAEKKWMQKPKLFCFYSFITFIILHLYWKPSLFQLAACLLCGPSMQRINPVVMNIIISLTNFCINFKLKSNATVTKTSLCVWTSLLSSFINIVFIWNWMTCKYICVCSYQFIFRFCFLSV